MYFAGDTVYKFFRVVFVLCGLAFAYQLVRCGLYDLDVDYVKGIIVYIIGAISYGIMWIVREFY